MKSTMKKVAILATVAGLFAVTACEEMLAVTEGLMTACQADYEACDEALFTSKGPAPIDKGPPPLFGAGRQ